MIRKAEGSIKGIGKHMDEITHPFSFSGNIAIAQDGNVLFQKCYGLADIEHNVPHTPQSKFRIGSLSKAFTALGILMLEEQGKLNLTDTLNIYIPELLYGKEVTIHHLLSHTSGIPNFVLFPEFRNLYEKNGFSPEELIELLNPKGFVTSPGKQYSYSNTGYYLLALIIEKVSQKSYEAFLTDQIFNPLQMNNSGYDLSETILSHRARGYKIDQEHNILQNADYLDMKVPFGGGGLYSTIEDLLLWDKALFSPSFISTMILNKLYTPNKENYGYGWRIFERHGQQVVEHGGGICGFTTHMQRYLTDKMTIIVLSNYQIPWAAKTGHELANILFDA
ncbi:serine hydrolase domain-containing protein [Bacillus horti]|uniref:CubicO group peptidase (Beta-lactamase class C family) n=1 Tax=Caldalkalibacillus horti TaxID=77523 RepID=A0ABT9W4J8_9BACI|nr:serine hydrolase domain-containing protein [Bacillus horti]MDQ0168164.1 CubicO group peptidase (beta-lactamase class C family) [Bacillus horti]